MASKINCFCGCGEIIYNPRKYKSSRTHKIVTQKYITGHNGINKVREISKILSKAILKSLYNKDFLSATQIAKKYRVNTTTIILLLKKYNIEVRNKKQSQRTYLKFHDTRSLRQSEFMKNNNPMSSEKGRNSYNNYIHTQPKSSLEIKFENELKRRNIEYKEQVSFRGMFLDFVIKDKIAVEVDGVYWHNMLEHKARDKRKDKLLLEEGYQVFRFTDKEILTNVKSCVDKILKC